MAKTKILSVACLASFILAGISPAQAVTMHAGKWQRETTLINPMAQQPFVSTASSWSMEKPPTEKW